MRFIVERMTLADVPRVSEIERLAYTTPWPSSAYRKELQENPLAHYIIARDTQLMSAPAMDPAETSRRHFPLSLLPGRHPSVVAANAVSMVGFSGLWLMVDEAHITTIAVHPRYRGRGVGELLLSSLIQIAYDIQARMVTLEARVSNQIAQNLYRKYGFREAGIRRRYYSDNNEDAVIMWTPDIYSPAYRDMFDDLRARLAERLVTQEDETDSASHG